MGGIVKQYPIMEVSPVLPVAVPGTTTMLCIARLHTRSSCSGVPLLVRANGNHSVRRETWGTGSQTVPRYYAGWATGLRSAIARGMFTSPKNKKQKTKNSPRCAVRAGSL